MDLHQTDDANLLCSTERFPVGSGSEPEIKIDVLLVLCNWMAETIEMEVWKLVMPWLDSQELGILARTCRAIAGAVRFLTDDRACDVTQGQETFAVPVVNNIDDCRYPSFYYTPFCQVLLPVKNKNKWGPLESRSSKLVESEFAGAMTMGSVLRGVGCRCLDLCTSSENLPLTEDEDRTTLQYMQRKRRRSLDCYCGRLVGGQTAYDQVSRLIFLIENEKLQRTRTRSEHMQAIGSSGSGGTITEAMSKKVDELQGLVDVTGDRPVQEEVEGPFSMMECGPACSCCFDCKYRVSQHGVCVRLKVVRTNNKGWSLCASQQITQGTFVCEYAGELLTNREAQQRHTVYDSLRKSRDWQGSALLVLREHLPSGRATLRVNVDATRIGNVARFINHSCDGGNLLPCIIRLAGCPIPKLALFAKRSISDGEELTYSYGAGSDIVTDKMPCFCGTPACLGALPAEGT